MGDKKKTFYITTPFIIQVVIYISDMHTRQWREMQWLDINVCVALMSCI